MVPTKTMKARQQFSRALLACYLVAALLIGLAADAQRPVAAQHSGAVAVPGFWDPRRRPERPDLTRLSTIRFLTESDYPPFNYQAADGMPAGFNVELARLLCDELKVNCTIQVRRFDTLIPAIEENRGDAVIASLKPSLELRRRVDFTDPYYRTPARFAARKEAPPVDIRPERLEGRRVAAVAGTAHEAYLKTLFTEVDLKPVPTAEAGREALRRGEVDLLFADGIALALWLNGTDSGGCCEFRGGPFTESRYFGEGIGIAVRRGNDVLRLALNWALFRTWEKGQFTDLWLRYFPLSPF
jgi:polar amino acid transport system substrate-binding protein